MSINKILVAIAAIAVVLGAVAVIDDSDAAGTANATYIDYDSNYMDSGLPVILVTFDQPLPSNVTGYIYQNGTPLQPMFTLGGDEANANLGLILLDAPLADGTGYSVDLGSFSSFQFSVTDGVATLVTSGGDDETYSIDCTVNDDSMGTVTFDAPTTGIAAGTEVIMTVTAYTGYEIVSVTVDSEPVQLSDNEFRFTVNADVNVAVVFQKAAVVDPTYSIDCSVNDNAMGSVSFDGPTDGIAAGETVTMTVTPNEGYEVDTVTVNGEVVTLVGDSYTITDIQGDVTVEVTFKEVEDTPVDPEKPLVMEEMYVNGIAYTSTEFGPNQIVIVNGTWTLTTGTEITIKGQLVVPEGSSIVIEAGAKLIIDSSIADTNKNEVAATIDGEILVDNDDTVTPAYGLLAVQNGTVVVSGDVSVYGQIIVGTGDYAGNGVYQVAADGVTDIQETGVVTGTGVTVYGTLNVYGQLNAATVYNYGTVVISSSVEATGDVVISMLQSGAVVDVQMYTSYGGSIAITDADLVFKKGTTANPGDVTVTTDSVPNRIVLGVKGNADGDYYAQFTGLLVTEAVSQKTVDGETVYTNTMDVSGDMAVIPVYDGADIPNEMKVTATVDLYGQKGVAVTGELVVGSGITVNNHNVLNVTGSVDAVDGAIVNTGEVTVSGAGIITVKNPFDGESSIVNATKYTTGSGNDAVTTYVTIDAALATVNQDGNTITQLTVLGKQTVTVSAVLPAGVTMYVNGAQLSVGDENGSDVVLTVAERASVRGTATVTVNGTVYAENKRNVNSSVTIVSDVYSEEVDENGKVVRDGWARWTNVYTAMAEASEGDVVQVYKDADNGYVEISRNLTVPAGVTLVVADGKAPLLLKNGVTLTVNGTLQTSMEVYAESRFGTSAMNVTTGDIKQSSAIVVNGHLYTANALTYGNSDPTSETGYSKLSAGAPIAGAYYTYTIDYVAWNAVSPLANAVANVAGISGVIKINGAVNAGDVTFTATEDCDTIEVVDTPDVTDMNGQPVDTVLTVGSLTLVGSTLTANAEVNGTVVVGEAVLDVADVAGITVQDDEGMLVSGTVNATAEETAAVTLTAGTATVTATVTGDADNSVVVTVASGATMLSDGASIYTLNVEGTLEIAEDAENPAIRSEGTVTVASTGVVNIGSNESAVLGSLVVYGQFNVAVATETTSPGTATAVHLDVGIDADAIKNGTAGTTGTVTGPVTVTVTGSADVSAQATVSAETQAALDQKISTAFDVEGSVWFTKYVNGGAFYLPAKAPVENAYLAGWLNENGVLQGGYDEDGNVIQYTARQDAVLTADIEYNVYHIYVLANEAVDDVFIDGNLMQYGIILTEGPVQYYGYYTVVSAGSHTISCTLANGYSGDGVLTVNGTQQSGWNFTTEGTPATAAGISYSLQLSSFEKSGYVPDSPDTPSDSGDDGMSITDILLIVLVILIIVMAIIVAVRLMRS